jgi:hypothetical protein
MKRVLYILFVLVIACSKESEIIPEPNPTVKYILTISAEDGGTVSSSGGQYEEGTSVTFSATADSGYIFQQWSDGNTDNPRTIIINSNINVTANFLLDCSATKYEFENFQSNSYSQRFIYHHKNIYEIIGEIDSNHGDHVTNYGTNSISLDYNNDGYFDFISFYSDYAIQDDRRYV